MNFYIPSFSSCCPISGNWTYTTSPSLSWKQNSSLSEIQKIISILKNRKGRKEMFYLMMHSTHFIYAIYMVKDHMVKDHTDSKRGNRLPPHGLLFPISSKHPTDRITHTMAFGTPVVEHWLEREKAQWAQFKQYLLSGKVTGSVTRSFISS